MAWVLSRRKVPGHAQARQRGSSEGTDTTNNRPARLQLQCLASKKSSLQRCWQSHILSNPSAHGATRQGRPCRGSAAGSTCSVSVSSPEAARWKPPAAQMTARTRSNSASSRRNLESAKIWQQEPPLRWQGGRPTGFAHHTCRTRTAHGTSLERQGTMSRHPSLLTTGALFSRQPEMHIDARDSARFC